MDQLLPPDLGEELGVGDPDDPDGQPRREVGGVPLVDVMADDLGLLDPVDVFPRSYGTLETRFARVVRA